MLVQPAFESRPVAGIGRNAQLLLLLLAAAVPVLRANVQPHSGPITVELAQLGDRATVHLNAGDTLRVLLAEKPSTGYSWRVSKNDAALLKPGTAAGASAGKRLGASAQRTFVFTASAPGRDSLVLSYQRPWEKNAAPAKSYLLDIAIAAPRTPRSGPAIRPEGVLLGAFAGKLPCADCSGILETLRFYAAGRDRLTDTYYVRSMHYLGRSSFIDASFWTIRHGTPSNADSTVYLLRPAASDSQERYRLEGDTLIPLDSGFHPIQGPFDMKLRRVP